MLDSDEEGVTIYVCATADGEGSEGEVAAADETERPKALAAHFVLGLRPQHRSSKLA